MWPLLQLAPAKTEDCPLKTPPGEAEKPKLEKTVQIREKGSPEAMEVIDQSSLISFEALFSF